MALSDIEFTAILKTIIETKEPLLQERLEGGLSPIRNDEFLTNNYKGEDLIEPSDGLYDTMKQIEVWALENMQVPGQDPDEMKKKLWKKHSEEMSKQISKQVGNWIKDDVIPPLAMAINSQIKELDIKLTVPPGMIYCGPYPNAAPIILEGGAGLPEPPAVDAPTPDFDATLTVDFEIT